MGFSIFINFAGNCKEAVAFYASVFGKEMPQIMTYGEAPPEPDFSLPEEAKNLVMYTALDIGGAMVMFCDLPPDACLTLGNQINPVFSSTDVKEVQNVFARLAEGGTIEMPLAKTFFSPLYGMVTDKYGITWQIDAETGEAKDS